ncbi:four helix bundle protein [Leptolyngbya sp. O-77]|uniref:four helix bundle protein n=1 Tax=Leptolyngbya sp. O-77 TaxID=1080068 RepID=UPI002570F20A|nr:four helix bundle protein [Leptolyngbya sp. O-77]
MGKNEKRKTKKETGFAQNCLPLRSSLFPLPSSFFLFPSSLFVLPFSLFPLPSSFGHSKQVSVSPYAMPELPKEDLRQRTKAFALRIIKVYNALPKTTEAQVLGKQLLRSGTSVGAHYREAVRSRSKTEYISKIGIGLQELEESIYWLELLTDAGLVTPQKIGSLMNETNELIAIFVALSNRARRTREKKEK